MDGYVGFAAAVRRAWRGRVGALSLVRPGDAHLLLVVCVVLLLAASAAARWVGGHVAEGRLRRAWAVTPKARRTRRVIDEKSQLHGQVPRRVRNWAVDQFPSWSAAWLRPMGGGWGEAMEGCMALERNNGI